MVSMCRNYEESKRGTWTPQLGSQPGDGTRPKAILQSSPEPPCTAKQSVLLKSQAPDALNTSVPNMADDATKKPRTFRKFTYRGVDLDQLLDMKTDELVDLFPARARRK